MRGLVFLNVGKPYEAYGVRLLFEGTLICPMLDFTLFGPQPRILLAFLFLLLSTDPDIGLQHVYWTEQHGSGKSRHTVVYTKTVNIFSSMTTIFGVPADKKDKKNVVVPSPLHYFIFIYNTAVVIE